LAAALGLGVSPGPWHSARDTVAELAGWLSLTTASLAKIGTDVLLLAQSEVAEVRLAEGGGSSTMPQKANPVAAEALVTLGRVNADGLSTLHHAVIHAHERDGAAWAAEWLALPPMMTCAGAATRTALDLLDGLVVDEDAMRSRVTAGAALAYCEPAVFALAAVMPRDRAVAMVSEAAARAQASGRSVVDLLEESLGAVVDWAALRRLDATVEAAGGRTRAVLAELAVEP
jgi:3-carboxy-cis,cis-muconate cycloisomerase